MVLFANYRAQFLLDHLGRYLKLFVSDVIPFSRALASVGVLYLKHITHHQETCALIDSYRQGVLNVVHHSSDCRRLLRNVLKAIVETG